LVVGGGKSAAEIATGCANTSIKTFLVHNGLKLMIEDQVFGIKYNFLLSPLLELLPPLKGVSIFYKVYYYLTRPIANIIIMSYIFALALKHGRLLFPDFGSCNAGLSPPQFWEYVKSGLIEEHQKTRIKEFKENGFKLENEKFLEVDLVILGTGFTFDTSIFSDNLKLKLLDNRGFILYKKYFTSKY